MIEFLLKILPSAFDKFIEILVEQFFNKKEHSFYAINIPKRRPCIGRERELLKLKKNILGKKSVIILGTAGIGKTTLCYNAVYTLQKKIKSLYPDGQLYHDYYGKPSYDEACTNFAEQLKVDLKSIEGALHEKRCLIVLDSCENAENIDNLLSISTRSIFIICSRNSDQKFYINKYFGSQSLFDSCIDLPLFTKEESLALLKEVSYKDASKDNELLFLANLLGYLPIALFLATQDVRFLNDLSTLIKILSSEGAERILEYNDIDKTKAENNLILLIDRTIGITDDRSGNLTVNAKRILGFLGAISFDYIDINSILLFLNISSGEQYLYELIRNHLVEDDGKGNIKLFHNLLYARLRKNCFSLLGNAEPILLFIDFLERRCGDRDIDDSNFLNDKKKWGVLNLFRNHLYASLNFIIDNSIEIQPKELRIYLGLLLKTGMYKETLALDNKIKESVRDSFDFNSEDGGAFIEIIANYYCNQFEELSAVIDGELAIITTELKKTDIDKERLDLLRCRINNLFYACREVGKFEYLEYFYLENFALLMELTTQIGSKKFFLSYLTELISFQVHFNMYIKNILEIINSVVEAAEKIAGIDSIDTARLKICWGLALILNENSKDGVEKIHATLLDHIVGNHSENPAFLSLFDQIIRFSIRYGLFLQAENILKFIISIQTENPNVNNSIITSYQQDLDMVLKKIASGQGSKSMIFSLDYKNEKQVSV